jgi:hypothetical protein
LCASFSALAAFETGNSLLEALKAPPSGGMPLYAAGFITGVAEASSGRQAGAQSSWCFDLPSEVTRGQLVDLVRLYLEQKPALRHFTASSLVRAALDESYPCR